MKDLIALKRDINVQLTHINALERNRKALLAHIGNENAILCSLFGSWYHGVIKQCTYQSYKARTTPTRHKLHCKVVEIKEAIRQAKAKLAKLQREHALGLKAQQERQKDNLFLEGKAIYDSLTGTEQNALDHYFLSKSYARTN